MKTKQNETPEPPTVERAWIAYTDALAVWRTKQRAMECAAFVAKIAAVVMA